MVGAKVCRVKPWTEMCGGRQGLQGQSLGLKCVVGTKVCRVKPWTEV